MIINGFEHIPKQNRKNILLLSDDLRFPSGVGTVSRIIVSGTAHIFNWFQVGAGINHPDYGKRIDVSEDINKKLGINDASVIIQPNNDYGSRELITNLLNEFKFDAILHFTDPHKWIWLYEMAHEIRQNIPILFYHVWDNNPVPLYNTPYYLSCDWIGTISKLTHNIVKIIYKNNNINIENKITYIPHGIDENDFYPINEKNTGKLININETEFKTEYELLLELKSKIFENDTEKINFILFYNNRNIRRKNPINIIYAYKLFCDRLTPKEADSCALIMHTDAVDINGTDLIAVIKALAPNYRIIIHNNKVNTNILNYFYNIADVTINISSAEGFGLSTAESLMAGTAIIATVTGGLQDQMGFRDENNNLIEFNENWQTNSDGKYKKCGLWCSAIFPSARNLNGSVATPYIYDDYINIEDVSNAIYYWYKMDRNERKSRGLLGREYLLKEANMSASKMNQLFIENINNVLKNWKPIERFNLIKI